MDICIIFKSEVKICEEKVRERNCSYSRTGVVNEKGHRLSPVDSVSQFLLSLTLWQQVPRSLWLSGFWSVNKRNETNVLTKQCRWNYIVLVFIAGKAIHAHFLKYQKQVKLWNVGRKMKISTWRQRELFSVIFVFCISLVPLGNSRFFFLEKLLLQCEAIADRYEEGTF